MNRLHRSPIVGMPLLPVSTLFIIGILTGELIGSMWIVAGAVIAVCIAALFRQYIYAAWIGAFALGAADIIITTDNDIPFHRYTGQEMTFKARIISAKEHDSSQSATILITHTGADSSTLAECRHIKAQLTMPAFTPILMPGYDITFRSSIEPVSPMTDLPDEIDPSQFLLQKQIRYRTLTVDKNIIDIKPSGGIIAALTRLRADLTDKIYASRLDTRTKEFINTTLLGDASDMDSETRSRFTNAGLSHILALSGLHVGLIAMLLSMALWPVKLFGHRSVPTMTVILLLWLYAAVTGFGPSVTRAVIMATIYLAGNMLQRRTSPINSLCAAALIILIFDPAALYSVGFQLSFAAVLSIILFADKINPVDRKHRWLYYVSSYISLSIAAMLGTALIAACYFHTIPLYFIPANIIAAILLPVILGAALLLMLCECIGFDLLWLCTIINRIYGWLATSADFFSALPHATITRIYLPGWITAIYAGMLTMLYLLSDRKKIAFGYCFAALTIVFAAIIIYRPATPRTPALYLARTTYRTDIVIDDAGTTLDIVTTRPNEPMAVKMRADMRYGDYMGIRSIDSVKIIVTPKAKGSYYSLSDNILRFGDKNIAIIDSNEIPHTDKVDYALICKGFMRNIKDVTDAIRPDTVIFCYDLHPKRRKRYIAECNDMGTCYISMRETSWSLHY